MMEDDEKQIRFRIWKRVDDLVWCRDGRTAKEVAAVFPKMSVETARIHLEALVREGRLKKVNRSCYVRLDFEGLFQGSLKDRLEYCLTRRGSATSAELAQMFPENNREVIGVNLRSLRKEGLVWKDGRRWVIDED